ncbi:MAG: hypothetical protein DDT19_01093 [Syntrophomonadaceae bacterium]|nr:hypothetical protein [Bacillota bacterium]
MAKDAYYFSHDSNARNDPKILRMRRIYKSEGYGWYWALVEMLREEENYKLNIEDGSNALAMQMQCEENVAHTFVKFCIDPCKLFASDGVYFWSNSLLRRMEKKEEKSEKARQAALSRWDKNRNANAMQTHSERYALKERKVKESKVKERKEDLYLSPTALSKATPYDDIISIFHQATPSLPRIQKLTDKRKKAIRACWRASPEIEVFKTLFKKAEASDFISGRSGQWTACSLDWLMIESNMLKVLEGNYDNRNSSTKGGQPGGRDFSDLYN